MRENALIFLVYTALLIACPVSGAILLAKPLSENPASLDPYRQRASDSQLRGAPDPEYAGHLFDKADLVADKDVRAGSFAIPWFSIDGGGGSFAIGSSYSLIGTVGQADAEQSVGGAFLLIGGFEAIADPCSGQGAIFCDGFESGEISRWDS